VIKCSGCSFSNHIFNIIWRQENFVNDSKKLIWLLVAMISIFALAACQPAEPAFEGETVTTVEAKEPPEEQVAVDVNDLIAADPSLASIEPIVWEDAETTDSGLQYVEVLAGGGATPQDGDLISMHYVAKLPDGTVLADSYSMGQPSAAIMGREQLLPGWEEGLALMQAGGKMNLLLPPDLAFGEEGYGMIPPNSQVVIEVELLTVEAPPAAPDVSESDLTETESGLQYFDIEVGDGLEAVEGSVVSTDYVIWVQGEDEEVFISASGDRGPATFTLGQGDMVFPGWDEGATGMKAGGKRYLVIPADLALGEVGGGDIPPGATLIMEIEMVEVLEPVVMTEVDEADYTVTESGLKYYDIVEGDGETPETGQTVVVHYTGWLEDGTKFDSSLDRGQPFSFALGTGGVIPGWDEGVSTMTVGTIRQLVVPAELGYGDAGAGGTIPPGATLIFEVELLEIQE
jgi:peptidylprolyl isomerase